VANLPMGRWFSTSISSRIPSENCDVQVEKESREERNAPWRMKLAWVAPGSWLDTAPADKKTSSVRGLLRQFRVFQPGTGRIWKAGEPHTSTLLTCLLRCSWLGELSSGLKAALDSWIFLAFGSYKDFGVYKSLHSAHNPPEVARACCWVVLIGTGQVLASFSRNTGQGAATHSRFRPYSKRVPGSTVFFLHCGREMVYWLSAAEVSAAGGREHGFGVGAM